MRNCLAFPRPEVWSNELHRADAVDGMLLRDYFAGIVLGGICGMEKANPSDMPIYVKRCYEVDDMMMQQRENENRL